jgi:peptidoglycan/xylan/chitin deacetylase (PgdA/CDA1 family)
MRLTILMYHKIDELPEGVRNRGNFVSPRRFEEQMDAVRSWGYQTITFEQWLDYRNGVAVPLPPRPLILTFDDGYACFDEHAWPVLRSRGMTATVFLVASQIGGANVWDQGEVRLPLMTAERIRSLQAEGVHFGSHSVSHRPLARIPADDAFRELSESRWTLSALLGREIDVFAYPFSNQSETVRALARQAGYRCAVRGSGRMNSRLSDPYGLRRIKVEPDTTVSGLRWTLTRERYLRPL